MSDEFFKKYISTTVLKDLTPLDDCLRTLTDANYFNIELGSTHPYEENVIEILAKYQANYLVHNYFPTPSKDLIVNVCSCDEIVRNKSIAFHQLIVHSFSSLPASLIKSYLNFNKSEDGLSKKTDNAVYTYEPDENEILKELLPKNIAIQIFKVLLESNAGEQGARMIAMDNATRNAGEMIDSLSLKYNRTRQAYITKELIEIISGAESI